MSDPKSDPSYDAADRPDETDSRYQSGSTEWDSVSQATGDLGGTAVDQSVDPPVSGGYAVVPASTTPDSSGSSGSSGSSATEAVMEQGGRVAEETVEGGKHVAEVAKDEAGSVASEAASQAKNLIDEARSQLSSQASEQKGSLVSYLRSFGDDFEAMLSGKVTDSGEQGPARGLAERASGYAQGAASWLDQREPSQILDEVSRFARRRPGVFLIIAAGAGLLAGRLTRGLTAHGDDDDGRYASQAGGYGPRDQSSAGTPGADYGTQGHSTGSYERDYAEGGYASSTAVAAQLPYESGQVVQEEEGFGLPDGGDVRTGQSGEIGYDDRGRR